MGAGQIGLLATLILTLRGLDVYTLARSEPPTHNSAIVEAMQASYVSISQVPLLELAGSVGKADLIINARVAIDPEKLEEKVREAVKRAAEQLQVSVTFGQVQSFRPGRPVPTHRMS